MKRILLTVVALAALASAAAAAPIDTLQQPLATPEERELYAPIANNPKEVAIFMATRKFVRQHEASGGGKMPPEFDFRYLVDIPEQLKYFQVAMAQGFKKIATGNG